MTLFSTRSFPLHPFAEWQMQADKELPQAPFSTAAKSILNPFFKLDMFYMYCWMELMVLISTQDHTVTG